MTRPVKNVLLIKNRIVSEYERGDKLIEMLLRFHNEGFTTETGATLQTSDLSKIAHKAGCAKRAYRKSEKKKIEPKIAKQKTFSTDSFDSLVLAEILMSDNLSDKAKKEFIKWKLS